MRLDNNTNNTKIDWISKAKGFGILGILAIHTVYNFTLPNYIVSVCDAGKYCVQLFFIISAYLTFKSVEKAEIDTIKKYLHFILHKLIRFIPILYIVSFYCFISYCVKVNEIPCFSDGIWKDLFFSITFLNGFSVNHINPCVNWYIGTLIIFIVIAPFLYRIIINAKRAVVFFAFVLITSWIISIFIHFMHIQNDYYYFWFPNQFPVMMLGVIYYSFEKESFVMQKNTLCFFLSIISFCFLLSMSFFTTPMAIHVRYGLLIFIFTLCIFSHSNNLFYGLKVLGDNSYGIYLIHWQLIPFGKNILEKYSINQKSILNYFIFYLLILVISLLISIILRVFVERPFIKLMKKKGF